MPRLKTDEQNTTGLREGPKKTLVTIINFIDEYGYAPSIREICDLTGYSSTCSVAFHVKELVNLGYLETDHPGSPRAIRIGMNSVLGGYADLEMVPLRHQEV